jgi:hypothetical protein
VTLIVIAQPNVQRSEPSYEAQAISALRAIASAQAAYAAANGGYATSLKALAAACSHDSLGFVSPDLAHDPAIKGRYEISVQPVRGAEGPVDCNGVMTSAAYYASARPVGTPLRAFATDQSGIMWYDTTGVPPKPPFTESNSTKPLR